MKKKIIFLIVLIFLIGTSFGISFWNGKKEQEKREAIEEVVITYLKDKYNEEFEVVEFAWEKNGYDIDNGEDYVTEVIENSYIYTLTISSARLINFKVLYVVYDDEKDYISNKEYNIIEEGLYENYIYEYKMNDIKKEIRNEVLEIVTNFDKIDVSMDNLISGADNILINYSLDSEEMRSLYEEYNSFDKRVSNLDFYNLYLEINNKASLILNIDVDDYIDSNSVDDFKKEVRELVLYLEDIGYENYDINYSFNRYESARATKYIEDGKEKIYLVFDYEGFSDVSADEKLTAMILDK